MKVFNVENGKEKVYVQVEDFATFTRVGYPIPASIYAKAMDIRFVTNDNRYNFVVYDTDEELDFFRNFEWIIDYKELRDKTGDEMRAIAKLDNDEANDIADLWNTLTPEEKRMNVTAADRYALLHHRIKSYGQILWNKQANIHLNFPLVPDSDGFCLESEDGQFKIESGLDPRTLLLSKTDDMPLSEKDVLDIDFIDRGLAMALGNIHNTNEYFGTFDTTRTISDDRNYLIIQIRNAVYVDTIETKKGSK